MAAPLAYECLPGIGFGALRFGMTRADVALHDGIYGRAEVRPTLDSEAELKIARETIALMESSGVEVDAQMREMLFAQARDPIVDRREFRGLGQPILDYGADGLLSEVIVDRHVRAATLFGLVLAETDSRALVARLVQEAEGEVTTDGQDIAAPGLGLWFGETIVPDHPAGAMTKDLQAPPVFLDEQAVPENTRIVVLTTSETLDASLASADLPRRRFVMPLPR